RTGSKRTKGARKQSACGRLFLPRVDSLTVSVCLATSFLHESVGIEQAASAPRVRANSLPVADCFCRG
ncbi:MAG: hypothetical protein RR463_04895, partial [Hydrogenoanaerobacterium sp.]